MAFIPHTQSDTEEMLNKIGVNSIENLFAEIPVSLKNPKNHLLNHTPDAHNEFEMLKIMKARANENKDYLNFIGAGAYEHHIPAAVWDIVSRGEFYSAYTPYQAEASQGTLQLLYEYQTMIANLTSMDVANASMYDGATALAESVLMAVRLNRKVKSSKILCAGSIHPNYLKTLKTLIGAQNLKIDVLEFDESLGKINTDHLPNISPGDYSAMIIPQPNFLGQLESVDELINWANHLNIITIGLVNPIAMSVFKAPGQWGENGCDIACGDGQPLGVPLCSGGPYVGFMACKQKHVRQMPGRIIGKTTELDSDKIGYALTLQAREQHIRRGKATSNICTNQSLLVTANTIFVSLLGAKGLRKIVEKSRENLIYLSQKLKNISDIKIKYNLNNCYSELVLNLPYSAEDCIKYCEKYNILPGFALNSNDLLICVTETKDFKDIDLLVNIISQFCGER